MSQIASETALSSSIQDSTFRRPGLFPIGLMVFTSVLIPTLIVGGCVHSFLSEKPWGIRTAVYKNYLSAAVKQDEMWFVSSDMLAHKADKACKHSLKRFDVKTGIENDTGISVTGVFCVPVWIKDSLYLLTDSAIYKSDGVTVDPDVIPFPSPRPSSVFADQPRFLFDYDGQLTSIVEPQSGKFQLVHYLDGQWVAGQKIRLPGMNRVWYFNQARDRHEFWPMTSEPRAPSAIRIARAHKPNLVVFQQSSQTHLLISQYPDFSAYRNGFEFEDDDDATASALSPENSTYEVSGWEPVMSISDEQFIFDQMKCDRNGPVFLAWGVGARCVRRHPDGRWETIPIQPGEWGRLRGDPSQDSSYIMDARPWYATWGNTTVRRIDGTSIQPAQLELSGEMHEYLSRWRQLRMGLFIAWLTHWGIVMLFTSMLTRRTVRVAYTFGHQSASFASLQRRFLAGAVDASVALAIFGVGLWCVVRWASPTIENQCNALFEYELQPYRLLLSSIFSQMPQPTDKSIFLMTVLVIACGLLIQRIVQEGRGGTTIGKSLFGIQTLRSTLRPCGVSRSLLRTLFYWIDLLNLLSPLPAAISIIRSSERQRLGDRVADTVVIRTSSIRELSSSGQRVFEPEHANTTTQPSSKAGILT